MNWATIMCWTLLLLAAFFCENVTSKGGRGGARGAARGRGRSSSSNSRMRMKPAPRYSSSGSAFRVAAAASAGAAAGAAAGAIAGVAGRRISGEVGTNDGLETDFYYGNQTREGVYSYRYQQHKTQELEEFQFLSIYSSAISQLCSKVFVPNHVLSSKREEKLKSQVHEFSWNASTNRILEEVQHDLWCFWLKSQSWQP